MRRQTWVPLFVLSVQAATVWPRVAWADTDRDRAAARSLADRGADAFDEGDYARALELFSRAEQLVHAPPHLSFMARSLAKLGRLVEAHEMYLKIVNEDLPTTAPRAFKAAHEQAEAEIGNVEARIAHVTVTIRGGAANKATLSIDHTDIPAAEQGIPLPIDPGTHVFAAHNGSARSEEKTVTLGDGTAVSLELTLPAAENTGLQTTTAAPPTERSSSNVWSKPTDSMSSGAGRRIVAYSAFGVGAVGIGVGTYFTVSALSSRHSANQVFACDTTPERCTADEKAIVSHYDHESKIARGWAIAAYAVGAAGIGTGVVLLLTGTAPKNTAARIPELRLFAGVGSLALAGRF